MTARAIRRAQGRKRALVLLAAASLGGLSAAKAAPRSAPARLVIDISTPAHARTFVPQDTFGAAIDGMGRGDVARHLTASNIETIRTAGLKRITYRTRPELGVEAWHWSAEGSWSDPGHSQGYWTGSDHPAHRQEVTWGYSLPRRGDSVDQANDTGYSRLDDGDETSFWKSNPYLDRRYTGLAQSRPQWIVVDFGKPEPIDAVRIAWGAPWAVRYEVQAWTGRDPFDAVGAWKTFPTGALAGVAGPEAAPLRLAPTPIAARYVRILLERSSETAPEGSTDPRDKLGYAVRELYLGAFDAAGRFHDVMRHGPDQADQTLIQVSSTDPWHRAIDRNPWTEQPGLDLIYGGGLTGGLPMMVPVGVLYDTPENAAAEIRFLQGRGYPLTQVELGEEPDGQFISPEDYADLYIETAHALHAVDPKLSLGGPSMQGAFTVTWPDPEGGASWIGRYVSRMKARGALDQFGFFSFEHYPVPQARMCGGFQETILDEPAFMARLMQETRAQGVSPDIPWIISEYGMSPYSGRAMSLVPAALLDVDIVGQFLTRGGSAAYMFGYDPDVPINQLLPCAGYGNMTLFDADATGRARNPMPAYWAERMMTTDWATPADGRVRLFAASVALKDAKGRALVGAYPLQRPDGSWAVMLVNRDEAHPHAVRIGFRRRGRALRFGDAAGLSVTQYSRAQYEWLDEGRTSRPIKDLPPERFHRRAGPAIDLPAYSLTVVVGAGPRAAKR